MRGTGRRAVLVASACFAVSAAAVGAGVLFGRSHVAPDSDEPVLNFLLRWDGEWYRSIAEQGYTYSTEEMSSAVFFPGYPLLARGVSEATGMDAGWALVLVSNLFAWGAFVVLYLYARDAAGRWGIGNAECGIRDSELRMPHSASDRVAELSVLLAAFAPISYFFHIGYAESAFLFFALLALVLMSRGAAPVWVALAVAGATVARPVGAALLPALGLYALSRVRAGKAHWLQVPASAVVGVAGLAAFMLYLDARFGTPLAFASAGEPWRMQASPPPVEKLWLLASLAPVREHLELSPEGLCSPAALNVLFFLGVAGVVAVGAVRRWLTLPEVLAAAGLLLIPYWSLGIEREMNAMARYSLVVFPMYPVLARMLRRLPMSVVASLVAGSCVLMVLRTATFTSHPSAHSVVQGLF